MISAVLCHAWSFVSMFSQQNSNMLGVMCIGLRACVFVREFSEPREEAPQLTSQGLKAAVCLPVCREREEGGQEGALGKRSGRAVWKKKERKENKRQCQSTAGRKKLAEEE